MASTIKLKTSTDSGSVPESLSKGEVAINVTDGVWYYGGASAVQQNFKFGSVTVTGDTYLNGGDIDGTRIGRTTRSSGNFTNVDINGNLVVTGNTHINGRLSGSSTLFMGNGAGMVSAATIGAVGDGAISFGGGSSIKIPDDKSPALVIEEANNAYLSFFTTNASPVIQLYQPQVNTNTLTVGVDGTGHDVKFFGSISGQYMKWDQSEDKLNVTGEMEAELVHASEVLKSDGTLVVTGNTVLNGTLSATTSLKVGNGDGTISAATITSSGDMTSGGDVYTDVVRRQSDSSTTTKIKLDDETIKCFGSSSSVWSTKVSSQQLEVGQGGAGVISAATVTGLGFVGTKHILRCMAFYVNANPLVQNSLYFGQTLGAQNSNFNDPAAVGGAFSSVSTFTIIDDDMNWGIILPFDISKVEIQCSLRPNLGTGDDFSLVLYTGIRQDNSGSDLTLTKIAIAQTTFAASKYKTNDLTYTGNLDEGTMIYVGVGSEDATDAKNARGIMNIVVTQR